MKISQTYYTEEIVIWVEIDQKIDTNDRSRMPHAHLTHIKLTFARNGRSADFVLQIKVLGCRVRKDGQDSQVSYAKSYYLATDKPDYVEKAVQLAHERLQIISHGSAFWEYQA